MSHFSILRFFPRIRLNSFFIPNLKHNEYWSSDQSKVFENGLYLANIRLLFGYWGRWQGKFVSRTDFSASLKKRWKVGKAGVWLMQFAGCKGPGSYWWIKTSLIFTFFQILFLFYSLNFVMLVITLKKISHDFGFTIIPYHFLFFSDYLIQKSFGFCILV